MSQPFYLRRRICTQQPQQAAQIDPSCDFLRNAQFIGMAGQSRNLVNNRVLPITSGSVNKGVSKNGIGISDIGTGVGVSYSGTDAEALTNQNSATIFIVGEVLQPVGNADTNNHKLFSSGSPGNSGYGSGFWVNSYSNQRALQVQFYPANYAGQRFIDVADYFFTGQFYCLVATYQNNGTAYLYDKTGLIGSVACPAQPLANGEISKELNFGCSDALGTHNILVGGTLNRVVGKDEAVDFCKAPWQIFRAQDSRIWIPSAGGGSNLAASASGGDTASGSASLAAQVAIAGIGVSTASGSANAGISIPLSAAGISVAGGSANGRATVTISAAGLAQAAGQAGISASVLLQAAGAAHAAGNAMLATKLNALASGAAQAGGSANLSGGAPGALSATGGDTASGSAVLSVTVQLQAIGSDTASGTANLTGGAPGQISASGSAQAGGSATVKVTVNLTAAGFVQAMGVGQFSTLIDLAAHGASSSSGSARLTHLGVTIIAAARQFPANTTTRRLNVQSGSRPGATSRGNRPCH